MSKPTAYDRFPDRIVFKIIKKPGEELPEGVDLRGHNRYYSCWMDSVDKYGNPSFLTDHVLPVISDFSIKSLHHGRYFVVERIDIYDTYDEDERSS